MAELKHTDILGNLYVSGSLTVDGAIIQTEVEDLKIRDKLAELASGSSNKNSLNGAGIQFGDRSLNVFVTYSYDSIEDRERLNISPTISGIIDEAVSASHAREVQWSGVTGKIDYTGGKDISVSDPVDFTRSVDICLDSDIKVLGIQGNGNVGNLTNGDIIQSGSSLSEILTQILHKKLYPGKATPSSLSQIISSIPNGSSVVEKGTTISPIALKLIPYSGQYNCTYNQKYDNIGEPVLSWGNMQFGKLCVNGVEMPDVTTEGDEKIWTGSLGTVNVGENSIEAGISSALCVEESLPYTNDGTVYDYSQFSFGGEGFESYVNGEEVSVTREAEPVSFTITGVWPCYCNVQFSKSKIIEETTTKLPVQLGSIFTIADIPSEIENENRVFKFAYPETFDIVSFKVKSLSGEFVDYEGEFEYGQENISIASTLDSSVSVYNILKTVGGVNGPTEYQITLNKTMDQN